MKLKELLEEIKNEEQVRTFVTNGIEVIEWHNNSMLHMVRRYKEQWLDRKVKKVTVGSDGRKTILI